MNGRSSRLLQCLDITRAVSIFAAYFFNEKLSLSSLGREGNDDFLRVSRCVRALRCIHAWAASCPHTWSAKQGENKCRKRRCPVLPLRHFTVKEKWRRIQDQQTRFQLDCVRLFKAFIMAVGGISLPVVQNAQTSLICSTFAIHTQP